MMIYIARSFKYRQVSLTGVPVHHKARTLEWGGGVSLQRMLHATIGSSQL